MMLDTVGSHYNLPDEVLTSVTKDCHSNGYVCRHLDIFDCLVVTCWVIYVYACMNMKK